jgi:segregation and condensation protein B
MSLDPKDMLVAAIFSAGEPIAPERLQLLFPEKEKPSNKQMKQWLQELAEQYSEGPLELKKVASGYRFQVRETFAEPLSRISSRKPQRYSRATMETLALIIYKQPITRGEIEQVRGVAVSSHIIKTLQDRDWIKVVGHRDVPGKPALFATTKTFLDYFNLESISDLPPLDEVVDLESVEKELNQQLSLNVNPKNEDLAVPENQQAEAAPVEDEQAGVSEGEDGVQAAEQVEAVDEQVQTEEQVEAEEERSISGDDETDNTTDELIEEVE